MTDYDREAYQAPISPTQPMWLTPEEKQTGIDAKLKVAARRFKCPVCGKEFSLFQSRAIACKYCPKAASRCKYVRCPYCDSELPISGFITPSDNKQDRRIMNDFSDEVFNRWADTYNRR